jgi:hypothetical protein
MMGKGEEGETPKRWQAIIVILSIYSWEAGSRRIGK